MSQDEEHLKILSIFHYVVGGIAGLFACFPIFHFLIGLGALGVSIVHLSEETIPLAFMGTFFSLIAGSFIFCGWAFAIAVALTGWFLMTKKRYMFCLVVAGIECVFMPFGTVLGVFTIIVLVRPSVKELFEANQPVELTA